MVPKFRRSTQERLLHSGSRVLYVCSGVYVRVCTPGTCVQLCTKGKGFTVTEAGQVGLIEARPAGMASSQVDPPQVSRRCDGVALRAELLGTLKREKGGGLRETERDLCLCT